MLSRALILYEYMYIKNVHDKYQSSWFDSVKSILDNCCFSNIWESPGNFNFNSTWLNTAIKQRLFDQFQQEWRSNMENPFKRVML
jgi:hypothetical protein